MKVLGLLILSVLVVHSKGLYYLALEREYGNDEFVDIPINKVISVREMKWCLYFKLLSPLSHGTIFTDSKDNHQLYLDLTGGYGKFHINGIRYAFGIPPSAISLFTWINFCFNINEITYHVTAQGKLWYEDARFHEDHGTTNLTTLTIGKRIDATFKLTKFYISNKADSIDEASKYTFECNPTTDNQNILDWSKLTKNNYKVTSKGTRTHIVKKIDGTACRGDPINELVAFKPMTYDKAIHTCKILGGKMYLAKNEEDLVYLQSLHSDQICFDYDDYRYWMPIKKQVSDDFHWHIQDTDTQPDFLPWGQSEPNGRLFHRCALLRKSSKTFADKVCSYEACFWCHFTYKNQFLLRGLGSNSDLDNRYILQQSKFNDKIVFQGVSKGMILYDLERMTWVVYNHSKIHTTSTLKKHDEVAILHYEDEAKDLPLGLNEWHFKHKIGLKLLKFSKVSNMKM